MLLVYNRNKVPCSYISGSSILKTDQADFPTILLGIGQYLGIRLGD